MWPPKDSKVGPIKDVKENCITNPLGVGTRYVQVDSHVSPRVSELAAASDGHAGKQNMRYCHSPTCRINEPLSDLTSRSCHQLFLKLQIIATANITY